MDEKIWYSLPFDDDDDDFSFEDSHLELALEMREYADDDDDEFDEFERPGGTTDPAPPPASHRN